MSIGKACTGSSPSRKGDKHPGHGRQVHYSPRRDTDQIGCREPGNQIPTIETKVDLVLRRF